MKEHAREVGRTRTEREAYPELLASSTDRVREHTIKAQTTEQQCDPAECSRQVGNGSFTEHVAANLHGHRFDSVEHEGGLAPSQCLAHGANR